MAAPYTTQPVAGYNASPPVDDGTATDSNKIKWSTIKSKLTDPLNATATAMNSALLDAFAVRDVQFSAYSTASTNMINGVFTKVAFNVEDHDVDLTYDATTNYRWTAPRTGYVDVSVLLTINVISDTKYFAAAIYKNGAIVRQSGVYNGSGGVAELAASVHAGGLAVTAADYIEVFGYNGDIAPQLLSGTQIKNHFSVSYR